MSTAFKRILVGVDDSADAKLAFKHAINPVSYTHLTLPTKA